MFYKEPNSLPIFSLREIINGNVNVIWYGLKDVIPPCFTCISQNDYNNLSPLHIYMKENDNKLYGKDQRESIEFDISVSIERQDTTFD